MFHVRRSAGTSRNRTSTSNSMCRLLFFGILVLELATADAAAALEIRRRRFVGLERRREGGRKPPSEAQHVERVHGHDRALFLRLRQHLVIPGGEPLLFRKKERKIHRQERKKERKIYTGKKERKKERKIYR
jgi:hypothetical protein